MLWRASQNAIEIILIQWHAYKLRATLQFSPSNTTCWAAIKLDSHGHPTVPRSRVEANVTGYERFANAVENDSKTIDISLKQLQTELNKKISL